VQSYSQNITISKPTPKFVQARCLSCCPINSVKALKGKPDPAYSWSNLRKNRLVKQQSLNYWCSILVVVKGCMNNVTFGDENVGYYETVAGGAGAVSTVQLVIFLTDFY